MSLRHKILDPLLGRMFGTITRVVNTGPFVALTFDDGPAPQTTPRLLGILQRYQAKATFFMLGANAQRHPELVRQVAEAGHNVANHSHDHASLPYLSGAQRRAQIRDCAAALAPYGVRYFRPPYGNQSIGSWLDTFRARHQAVAWNLVAQDWLDHDAQTLFENVSKALQPGSIILFHDGLYDTLKPEYRNREPMLAAVETLLERYGDAYQFVTLAELLRRGKAHKQYWHMKADIAFLNKLQAVTGEARRYPLRSASTLPESFRRGDI